MKQSIAEKKLETTCDDGEAKVVDEIDAKSLH